MIRFAVIVFIAMSASPVMAGDADCKQARSVVFNDRAPCSGILVPAAEALTALKCMSEKLPGCKVGREADAKRSSAVKKALDAQLMIERKRSADLQGLLDDATRVAPPEHPWWKSPVLWTIVGVAVGVASTYAVIKLLEK